MDDPLYRAPVLLLVAMWLPFPPRQLGEEVWGADKRRRRMPEQRVHELFVHQLRKTRLFSHLGSES